MINITHSPILLTSGRRLDRAVRLALEFAHEQLQQEYLSRPGRRHAFWDFVGPANRRERPFDEPFLQAAYAWATTDSRGTGGSLHKQALLEEHLVARTFDATRKAHVHRGIRLAMVHLWSKQAMLLPSTFCPGSHFPFQAFTNELLSWLRSVDPDTAVDSGQKDAARRLHSMGHDSFSQPTGRAPRTST